MAGTRRRKVFVSFHSEDEKYRDRFVNVLGGSIVDRSVGDGDINKGLDPDEIRRQIRDDFIAGASVTVVLIGPCTWQRRHVDWEIGASLTDTRHNDRCGLLGILLPTHPCYNKIDNINYRLIPPRLACNVEGKDPFAHLHNWTKDGTKLAQWINRAFRRRDKDPAPNNSYTPFTKDRKGDCSKGWQN